MDPLLEVDPWGMSGHPWIKISKTNRLPENTGLFCAPSYSFLCFAYSGDLPCTAWFLWDQYGYILIHPSDGTFGNEDKPLPTHEIIHAFRMNWIPIHPQFEEGHAEAVHILVHKYLAENYGISDDMIYIRDSYLGHPQYVLAQYMNLPFIGTNLGPFMYMFGHEKLSLPRYRAWAYLLCNRPSWLPSDYNSLKNIANSAFGAALIEGEDFMTWFSNQPAFKNDYPEEPTAPYYLKAQIGLIPQTFRPRAVGFMVVYYLRESGAELPVGKHPLKVTVWDWDGRVIYHDTLYTYSLGVATFSIYRCLVNG